MKGLLRIGLLVGSLVAFGLIPLSVTIGAEEDAKGLFEKRCSICHSTSRPLGKTKSAEEWRQTVTRMKGYAGGKISDEEAEIIIEYLSETRGK
jgi:hypothetical protein